MMIMMYSENVAAGCNLDSSFETDYCDDFEEYSPEQVIFHLITHLIDCGRCPPEQVIGYLIDCVRCPPEQMLLLIASPFCDCDKHLTPEMNKTNAYTQLLKLNCVSIAYSV